MAAFYDEQCEEGRALLKQEGAVSGEVRLSADMCYRGQSNVISVAFPDGKVPDWDGIRQAFDQAYTERFGHLLDEADIVLVNARTTVVGPAGLSTISNLVKVPQGPMPEPKSTQVFFQGEWRETSVYQRMELPEGASVHGPALLLQPDSTTFVESGYSATVHSTGNIILAVKS